MPDETALKGTDKQELSDGKTLYSAGYGEIFMKNFLAGFGRALGSVFIYIIFFVAVSILFVNVVMPKLTPFLTIMANLSNSLQSLQNIKPSSGITIPSNLNLKNLFGQ